MKLIIVVGTRPEIIRLSATIKLIKSLDIFDTLLVHTGQNYDKILKDIFFEELDIPYPDIYLECNSTNLGTMVGDVISKTYNLFLKESPDAILILGDTNSCLCTYSAKRLKIPIFHLEAGNRCFDSNVPEEINRKLIDHLADINMCYTNHAKQNLILEGLSPKYIFVVGSPMTEIYNMSKDKINNSNILEKLSIKKNDYFLISTHREENVDNKNNLLEIINCINQLDKSFNKKIIISLHPRTRNKLKDINVTFSNNIILSEPFGFIDYCHLQKNSLCVISDSGTLTEESTILKFPAILLRNSTEHPEGIDKGNILIGNIKWEILEKCIKLMLLNKSTVAMSNWNKIDDYIDTNFSEKVVNIIMGYTGIVNKFVWMK
jgi:UDP-N-acetyl-L-fucosamine synthase